MLGYENAYTFIYLCFNVVKLLARMKGITQKFSDEEIITPEENNNINKCRVHWNSGGQFVAITNYPE